MGCHRIPRLMVPDVLTSHRGEWSALRLHVKRFTSTSSLELACVSRVHDVDTRNPSARFSRRDSCCMIPARRFLLRDSSQEIFCFKHLLTPASTSRIFRGSSPYIDSAPPRVQSPNAYRKIDAQAGLG